MQLNPGDMVYNKVENEVQLVIEVDLERHANAKSRGVFVPQPEALLLTPSGEMLWYPLGFLSELLQSHAAELLPRKAENNETR